VNSKAKPLDPQIQKVSPFSSAEVVEQKRLFLTVDDSKLDLGRMNCHQDVTAIVRSRSEWDEEGRIVEIRIVDLAA
jgi:hypothetical protein